MDGAAMSDRCTRSNANAAWTCVLPEGHEGDHIYTLWSEIAIHAEAAIQRVRDVPKKVAVARRGDVDPLRDPQTPRRRARRHEHREGEWLQWLR